MDADKIPEEWVEAGKEQIRKIPATAGGGTYSAWLDDKTAEAVSRAVLAAVLPMVAADINNHTSTEPQDEYDRGVNYGLAIAGKLILWEG